MHVSGSFRWWRKTVVIGTELLKEGITILFFHGMLSRF